jgi:hypothetical protein
MTRAEQKAIQARIAVRVCAMQAAKRAIKNQLRAQGLRVHELTAREITLRAEIWLAWHPEIVVEARAKAVALGYAIVP